MGDDKIVVKLFDDLGEVTLVRGPEIPAADVGEKEPAARDKNEDDDGDLCVLLLH